MPLHRHRALPDNDGRPANLHAGNLVAGDRYPHVEPARART
jgi:hypothetical protein